MSLSNVKLNEFKDIAYNSDKKTIISGKKYGTSTEVIGLKGKPYSAYFGIAILDKNENEISRKIQWLNDFSGTKKQIKVVFTAPEDSASARIIYRINNETPVNSDCSYSLLPLDKVSFSEVESTRTENFDVPDNFQYPKSRELSQEEELKLEKNLVWIFASPRSGTSWLGTQLLSYQTNSVNEPQLGVHLGMREPQIRHDVIRRIDLYKKDPDYFFSERYFNTWKVYLRKMLLNRLHAQVQDISKPLIVKEPSGAMGSDVLVKCTPNSKIIFMIRDARDILDSVIDALQKDSWAVKNYGITPLMQHKRLAEIKYQAMLWVKLIEILTYTFKIHPKEQRLMIKYEDLLTNTFEELEKIYSFIGIKIPKNELEKIVTKYSFKNIPEEEKGMGRVTRSAKPGKWKESFSNEEKEEIEKIIGETMKKLRYDC